MLLDMSKIIQKRKGAASIKKIDPKILRQLSLGEIESANLMECLAIDFELLAKSHGVKIKKLSHAGIIKKMHEVSSYIDDWKKYADAKSDTVRGFAAFSLASSKDLDFDEKLNLMKKFASDDHFSVREWAWLSMRNQISENLERAIFLLEKWSLDENDSIRRFASEATRPRGVWCAHISHLKENPQDAISILNPLKSDSSKYVQNSVGNWLNDAAKSDPEFVKSVTKKWKKESDTKETAYIIKRALRNL